MEEKVNPAFWVSWEKYKHWSDKADKWFDKSLQVKFQSIDFQICRLFTKKYDRIAVKYLRQGRKYLK